MTQETLLLIIDAQNDFCNPSGSLYVPGAENDIKKLVHFMQQNSKKITNIILSQDSHHVIDISHACFWVNSEGNNPEPFTTITVEDVSDGVWKPILGGDYALNYVKALGIQGEFPHVIWPEHCIDGSIGAAIVPEIMVELKFWAKTNRKFFEIIQKGKNPLTEHFGIVKANIPLENDISTHENKHLLESLKTFSRIYLAGEAKSHCVANTIKQLLPYPEIAERLIVIEDCMSPVTGFENIADSIFQKLKPNQFVKFTELI